MAAVYCGIPPLHVTEHRGVFLKPVEISYLGREALWETVYAFEMPSSVTEVPTKPVQSTALAPQNGREGLL